MGKLTTYIILMCGLSILFYMGGLVPSNPLLDYFLNPENLQNTGLYGGLIIFLSAVGIIAGIGIGFVSRNIELAAVSVFVSATILPLIMNFIPVIVSVSSTEAGRWISALLFGPTMIMFVIAVVEWTRGKD